MEHLPKEIWLQIFSYLDGESLKSVINASQQIADWLADEIFWFRKCKAGLSDVAASPALQLDRSKTKAPWQDLYINLICPYKYLLGYWQKFITGGENYYSGEVLKFFILPELGLMYGQITDGDSYETAVIIHSDGELSSHAAVEKYPLGITKHELLDEPVLTCAQHLPPDDHSSYIHHVYSRETIEFAGLPESYVGEEVSRWVKLRPLTELTNGIIESAVYKSLYGSHGFELIHVCALEFERKIIGSKITGDRNVPFGKHTFVIDLDRPMILNHSQQKTVESLEAVTVEVDSKAKTGPQPFDIPERMYPANDELLNFTKCAARYAGKMTISEDEYSSPSWCNAHYISFDSDNFAIYTEKLNSIFLYQRLRDIVY